MQIERILRAGCAIVLAAGAVNAQADAVSSFGLDAASPFKTVIDGRFGEQYNGPGTQDAIIHRKPYSDDDRSITIESLRIQNVNNQKALDITAGRQRDGSYRAYESIVVKDYQTDMVNRDGRFPGLHIDHLRIAGGGWRQDRKTDVYLENIDINKGDALPLLIQDGVYGTVHLKNVSLSDTALGSVQISNKGGGSIDRIIIEDSPDLSVSVMDRDNLIGDIQIIDSSGAKAHVRDYKTLTEDGSHFYEVKTGKVFSSNANWRQIGTLDQWQDDPNFDGWSVNAPSWDAWKRPGGSGGSSGSGGLSVQPVPEPGLLGLAAGGALLLRRRRR